MEAFIVSRSVQRPFNESPGLSPIRPCEGVGALIGLKSSPCGDVHTERRFTVMDAKAVVDNVIAVTGIAADAISASILLHGRRSFKNMPIFTSYVLFFLLSDSAGFAVYHTCNPDMYWRFYVLQTVVAHVLEVALAWELALTMGLHAGRRNPWIANACSTASIVIVACPIVLLVRAFHLEGGDGFVQRYIQWELNATWIRGCIYLWLLVAAVFLRARWRNLGLRLTLCMAAYFELILATQAIEVYAEHLGRGSRFFSLMQEVPGASWCVLLLLATWLISGPPRTTSNIDPVPICS